MNIFCDRNKHRIIHAFLACVAIFSFCYSSALAQAKQAYKLEELIVGAGSCEYVIHHLDYFALELQNNPTTQGYIIFYGGKTYDFYEKPKVRLPRRGEAEFRAKAAEGRLKWLKFDPNRYVVVNGGYREKFTLEFWIVPAGAEVPTPTPTIKANEIKFRKGKIKNTEDLWGCNF